MAYRCIRFTGGEGTRRVIRRGHTDAGGCGLLAGNRICPILGETRDICMHGESCVLKC